MTHEWWLLTQQIPRLDQAAEALLGDLADSFNVDRYALRQQLIGSALSLIHKGEQQQLEQMAALLRKHQWNPVLMPRPEVRFAPSRCRSFIVDEQNITFHCGEKQALLTEGTRIVGILADLSGTLVEKSLKRLLANRIYRGISDGTGVPDDDIYRTVIRSRPVLDLYLLDQQGDVTSAVRLFAGRFDPQSLGSRAGLSTVENMEALLALLRERVGDFPLYCDFGLHQIPGCRLLKDAEGDDAARHNLASLTRFGWVIVAYHRALSAAKKVTSPVQPEVVAALAGMGVNPAVGTAVLATGVAKSQAEKLRPAQKTPPATSPQEEPLPSPPDPPHGMGRMATLRWLGFSGGAFGFIFFIMVHSGQFLIQPLMKHGVATGIIPGLLALGNLWGGFYFLRLKRRIETTPTSKTRSLAMGLVELHGRARRKYALMSPMTQMPCVYYRLRKYRREDNKEWRLTSEMNSGHVPFYLEDGTGRVMVDPQGASIRVRTRQQGTPGEMSMLLASSGIRDGNEKWVEELLYEDCEVYVMGWASPVRVHQRSIRERVVERLRDLKLDHRKMQRFDTDGDGQISTEEWEAAREVIEQEVLRESLAAGDPTKLAPDKAVIGRPNQRGLPFVIAETASESNLTRNYFWLIVGLFSIGAGCFGWALYLVIHKVLS